MRDEAHSGQAYQYLKKINFFLKKKNPFFTQKESAQKNKKVGPTTRKNPKEMRPLKRR